MYFESGISKCPATFELASIPATQYGDFGKRGARETQEAKVSCLQSCVLAEKLGDANGNFVLTSANTPDGPVSRNSVQKFLAKNCPEPSPTNA